MAILSNIFKSSKKATNRNIEDDKNKIQKTDLFNSIQLLLEKLPIPVAVINKKKIIRGFNTLAKEEFGLKSNFNITHIIRNPIFVNSVNVAIKKNVKKFFSLEYESVLKKNFNVYVSSFGDNFLVSFVDTTQVYKLEKLKTDFIGNISHALKTPLAIILGIVETFIHQKRLSVKEKEGFLKTLNLETISMKNIVENLLRLSKIEMEEDILPKNKLNIYEIVKSVVDSFLLKAKKRKIKINLSAPKVIPFIKGDKSQLHQLFENLIDNSIKYSNLNSQIKINIQLNKKIKKIFIIINDESPGIPDKLIPRVTERFYRLETTQKIEGTGLGLSIVKHIANKHRAGFKITSILGKGSSLKLSFPF